MSTVVVLASLLLLAMLVTACTTATATLTPAPAKEIQELVDHVRYPNLAGDIDTRGA